MRRIIVDSRSPPIDFNFTFPSNFHTSPLFVDRELYHQTAKVDRALISNLVRAILPFGLAESDVHDNVNIFPITDIDEQDHHRLHPSPAKKGDYLEMFAEIDLLFALSTCPAGDESTFGWHAEKMKSTCLPLQVLVFTVEGKDLERWKGPVSAQGLYKGMHGLKVPVGEDH
ncbi:hypothetical protein E4T47_08673 [Aureobasidium subglaciale]|nr:hypothetical protein E4T47_08673 [Aureobasidium subglaciale]